jgi:HD superfamily phosphohydrolase
VTLPELLGNGPTVRIPELRNVPLTSRVAAIVDHPAFQRLRSVRQLGPTNLVYPGAVHTRFEHSLGCFDMGRQYLAALLRDPHVAASLTEADLAVCLLGCLLHDLGHYPFAHSLEAIHRETGDTPRHEDLCGAILRGETIVGAGGPSLASLIERGFGLDADEVVSLIRHKPRHHARPERRLVATVLSSGIDADKADYLERDAIHMGVGYGRNMDHARLLGSLCASPSGDSIAITDKGRVAAEILVFCRYTMFSEAYWHHTVRSASAMMERALADYLDREAPGRAALTGLLLSRSDDALVGALVDRSPAGTTTHALLSAMSGGRRSLYKRVVTLSRVREAPEEQVAYERVYHLNAAQLDDLEARLRVAASRLAGRPVARGELLVDTPPRDKDRIETVQVVYEREGRRVALPLEQVSKVVQGIATDFIKVVKKIRVFVSPAVRDAMRERHAPESIRSGLLQTVLDYQPADEGQQRLL